MRAYLAIVRVTLQQLLGGKRVLGLGSIALLPTLVMVLVTRDVSARAAYIEFHDAPLVILFLLALPIVALIFGAAALGDERREGTLSFLVTRPIPRSVIVAGKLTASWLATFVVLGSAAAVAGVVLFTTADTWSPLWALLVAAAVGAAAYTAVFLVLGHVTSRAVLIGLAYLFIWESGLTFAADSLGNVSLFRIALTAYAGIETAAIPLLQEPLASLTPGALGAAAKVVVISGLAVVAGATLLRRRDVT